MVVVLRFDKCDRDVRLVVEDVVGEFCLTAGDQLSADNNPAFGKKDLLANLRQNIPARILHGRREELGADVAFGEAFLIHATAQCMEPSEEANKET